MFITCSTPGCEIVVGNGVHGSKKPRACCLCERKNERARQEAYVAKNFTRIRAQKTASEARRRLAKRLAVIAAG